MHPNSPPHIDCVDSSIPLLNNRHTGATTLRNSPCFINNRQSSGSAGIEYAVPACDATACLTAKVV